MNQNPEFEAWFAQTYLQRYPNPRRNSTPVTEETVQQHRFYFAHRQTYQNEVEFNAEELAAYLTTQSNVVSAAEQGTQNVEAIFHWLTRQIKQFFKTEKARFAFGGYIWYLQKTNDSRL